MEYDKDKIDDYTLALLHLVMCGREEGSGGRAWKGFDWDTLNRLHDKGLIGDPRGKAKSVFLSEEACKKSEQLFWQLFGKNES